IRAEYVKYMVRILTLLGRRDSDAGASAAAVMRLETALAQASRKLEDLRDPLKNYNRVSPAELERAHTPSVPWSERLPAWNVRPQAHLDDRADQGEGSREARCDPAQGRLSGPLERSLGARDRADLVLRQPHRDRALVVPALARPDQQARRPHRVAHDAADVQRV